MNTPPKFTGALSDASGSTRLPENSLPCCKVFAKDERPCSTTCDEASALSTGSRGWLAPRRVVMFSALASGILLGLSAGLAPGPMLALVLAQTLRHGAREGCKVALTPLITDAPIILIALLVATRVAEVRWLLGIVSIAGGLFVLFLAREGFRPIPTRANVSSELPRSWLKGVLTNLLNPHPWLFWLTVGAATLGKAVAQSWLSAAAFLGGFYLLLVGSKVMVALLTGRSRQLLAGRGYRLAMRILSVLLTVFAVLLLREGVLHLVRSRS